MEEAIANHVAFNKDIGMAKQVCMKRDSEAVKIAFNWLEESKPFDHERDRYLLVSFLTGFTSTADKEIDAKSFRDVAVGRKLHIHMYGQSVKSTRSVKFNV